MIFVRERESQIDRPLNIRLIIPIFVLSHGVGRNGLN